MARAPNLIGKERNERWQRLTLRLEAHHAKSASRLPPLKSSMISEREAPELFAPQYDAEEITDTLIAKGLPAPVLREVLLSYVQWRRGDFEPRHPSKTPAERKAERAASAERATKAAEETNTRSVHTGLREIGPDFPMGDGRRLGDWTIEELRKFGGVFAFILEKAGTKDDSRTVDAVMSARDWKRANR